MVVVIVLVIVAALAGAFILGRAGSSNASPPTIAPPADGSSTSDCDQACVAWDNARQTACNAKSDEAAARAQIDGIRSQLNTAIAAAVSLGVAAAATFAAAAAATATFFGIPAGLVLLGIAIGLAVAAGAALLLVTAWTGALTAADSDLAAKTSARNLWEAEVARLRAQVNANCPQEKASACLNRPSPC